MPANKKHLTKSGLQRFAKISAGLVGGYMVTESFFMALAFWTNYTPVIFTLVFGGTLLWVSLLIIAFLAKNGWKIWGLYLLISFLFSMAIYLGKIYSPIIPA